MALDNLLAMFSRDFEENLYRRPTLRRLVDDRSGFFASGGTELTFNYLTEGQGATIRTLGNDQTVPINTPDTLADESRKLTLNQEKYVNAILFDTDVRDSAAGMAAMARLARNQARAFEDNVNAYISTQLQATSVYSLTAGDNALKVTGPTRANVASGTFSATNRQDYMEMIWNALSYMEDKGWFDDNMPPVFVTSTTVKNQIIGNYFRIDKPNYGAGGLPDTAFLSEMGIPVMGGIPILTDKSIPTGQASASAITDGTGLAGYFIIPGDSIKYAQSISQFESMRDPTKFGTLVRGLMKYGAVMTGSDTANSEIGYGGQLTKAYRVGADLA